MDTIIFNLFSFLYTVAYQPFFSRELPLEIIQSIFIQYQLNGNRTGGRHILISV